MRSNNKPSKLRVCMVVLAYYERDARVRRYAEALVHIGHSVDVLSLRVPGEPNRAMVNGVRVLRLPPARKRGGKLRYLVEYCVFGLAALATLSVLHLFNWYHVVHVHNMPDALVFSALLPRLLGAKVVLDTHDLMPEVYMSKFKVPSTHWAVRLVLWIERLSYRFASHVIFANGVFRGRALARGADPVSSSVVINAPDLRIFSSEQGAGAEPARRAEPFTLLYLGTISERHGVDFAVDGVARLRGSIPGIVLDIYPKFAEGEGEDLHRLLAKIAEQRLQDHVMIHEPVPLEQVPEVMAGADVGLFTPRLDVHIDSALSLKVPEYVAMGLPIVTTRTRIMQRYFDESQVMYFDDGDLDGFCAAIRKLHADPELRHQLAQNARRFLQEHSWEAERDRYLALVQ